MSLVYTSITKTFHLHAILANPFPTPYFIRRRYFLGSHYGPVLELKAILHDSEIAEIPSDQSIAVTNPHSA